MLLFFNTFYFVIVYLFYLCLTILFFVPYFRMTILNVSDILDVNVFTFCAILSLSFMTGSAAEIFSALISIFQKWRCKFLSCPYRYFLVTDRSSWFFSLIHYYTIILEVSWPTDHERYSPISSSSFRKVVVRCIVIKV